MITDSFGQPLAFCTSGGQRSDCKYAVQLLEKFKFDYALMDKAYDSDEIISFIEENDAVAVIPAKSNRLNPRQHDCIIYKERHAIECTFGWLKYFRRLFGRFEKLKSRFEDYFAIGASLYRMRYLNNA